MENKKLQHGLVVIVYFARAIHKKILIRISTIVVLPNALETSAQQLGGQNSILPMPVRNYSTKQLSVTVPVENLNLNPWWVTGFVDGEGCFICSITENKNSKHGWRVQACFQISLHNKDRAILEGMKNFFGVGKIYRLGPNAIQLRITNQKDWALRAPVYYHFKKFQLITQKKADCELWCEVMDRIERREHLSQEGLRQIVAIRASMNLGLSDVLKKAFPDVVPVVRPLVENPKIRDPNWLAGFAPPPLPPPIGGGEGGGGGCFYILITKSPTNSVGHQVKLVFQCSQHSRDENLMISIMDYLNCGHVSKNRDAFDFRVSKFQDMTEKIIPFFQKYPIEGVKALDFADFCKVAKMIKQKKHLTAEGLEQIRKIKAGMNRGRKLD